jgi:short-subunit dehydrogenase
MGELRNRMVVITGASSGFGKGVAEKFACAGANLVLAARRRELIQELARKCERHGVRALAVETDVSQAGQVQELAEAALHEYGRIDIWINNAGVATFGHFDEVPISEHEQVIRTNLLGCVYGSHAALQQFRAQGFGTLINVGSFAGVQPAPHFSSYAASKFGIRGLGISLRQELDVHGPGSIHVCTVMPTSMDTPFFQHAGNHTGKPVQPIPPVYDPQEVINAIYEVALHPKDEVIVGKRGKVAKAIRKVAPRFIEHQMAVRTHKAQQKTKQSAPETSGNLFEPVGFGDSVRGGWKKSSTVGKIVKTVLGVTAGLGVATAVLARRANKEQQRAA